MNEREKVLHQILTASQTGTIVYRLAKELDIPIYEAFRHFFTSKTYADFRRPGSILSFLSDSAIIQEYRRDHSY